MKELSFDVVIVGAGPAGLFAAIELIKGKNDLKIALIDMGKRVKERSPKEVMSGVGGGGCFSDGKLHFSPVLSHEILMEFISREEVENLCNYVDSVFTEFGVDADYYPKHEKEAQDMVDRCRLAGVDLVTRRVRHVGSDILPTIIEKMENFLIDNGVNLFTETTINDFIVDDGKIKGVVNSDIRFLAKHVIAAPGRIRARWMQKKAEELGIKFSYQPVEVGVRVEFPDYVMKKFSDLLYEGIFLVYTDSFDDVVRTFCPCPNGKVATETYDDFVCVNGHSTTDYSSPNSNFALVQEVKLTKPVENTIAYAKSIAELATTIGGGKPILQRYKDLKKFRRSTWKRLEKSFVKPSLTEVVPGDISMAFPHRIVTNLIEAIEKLAVVMPGINSDSTLLYAPEIKLRSSKIETDEHMETKVKNLYVAGDGVGLSGNIVGAAVTGVIAARGILGKQ
ncbi:MAG: NAD(P)/FAD-dependent oxidoreductase [Nanoarchaeota archaeon]|nr:NAD(P)/FAD-dependent oxidoreductase [Nanoarchaeota archaeon]